ncbi:MAG TPA: histidinol-phosphate transaminase [Candidatus Sulfotelmatobacter sp.]|jgi:histidinol-phosphate aminotransferase|nr:histidinol-phosphate transaminase [Candidatus Sulfotelmatobacter sp.]
MSSYLHPRAAVGNPKLTRPDWTVGQSRDPAKLWLDKNENIDPALSGVVTSVIRSLPAEAYFTYPETAALYAKLATSLGVESKNLLLAAGSDGVIRSVFEAFVEAGDRVLITKPTFAMYPVYSRMYGAEVHELDYEPSNKGPYLDPQAVIAAILRLSPKLVCIPNPDSPTGTVFAEDAFRAIIAAAGQAGSLILVDEAYYPFYDKTVVPWIAEAPHLVVARSTGKAWGCAGLRLGYAIAAPQVATLLHKVRPMYECNTVAVFAFERLLDHQDAMLASVHRLLDGKDRFLGAMEALGLRILRGHGNFLHVAFGEKAEAVHVALADIVLYRKDFADPCLKGFSRFSSTTLEIFEPIIARISATIQERE